jgi:hypothetical protein
VLRIPFINAAKTDLRLDRAVELFKQFLSEDPKLSFVREFTRREFEGKAWVTEPTP